MNPYPPNQREPDLESVALSRLAARWLSVLVGLVMFGAAAVTGRSAEARFKDYEVKAGFLYNFTKFVVWPTNSFSNTNAPFVLAVAGDSPCTAELEKFAKEHKVNGRDLVIKTVTTAEAARDAQILFVPAAEDARLKDWLAAARRPGVLTVGESESFFKQGGAISFLLEGEKMRFEINMDQAEGAGLQVSAQLQKLARTVRRKSAP